MPRTLRRLTLLALLLSGTSSLVLAPVEAHAQAPKPDAKATEEAKDRFKRGMQLYRDGSLEGALAELQRAYQLAPNWKILYNIAVIHRDKKNYAESIKVYEKFLEEGGKTVDAAKRKEVEKDLETMRKFVGTVEITTTVTGAEVKIDDEPVGATPLAPILVNAGKHRIVATAPGHTEAVETITIAGGDAAKVELKLVEPTKVVEAPSPAPPKPPPPPPPGLPILPIVLVGTGGAALVTGAVFGILTLSARSDADAGCKDGPSGHVCGSDVQSALDREKTFGLVTDISLVSGVVLVGVGTYLLVTSNRGDKVQASQGVTVVGRARVGGVELAGTF